ncbi:sec-independent protein translocase protein TATC, chloroplastic-like protein [Corchorus olitorius]|uniref:Sec-independent protein translocase protein TATC, chloroplastic-like protein n=1 Tax=Corchorus olitorius TaxID=93759 RepID=A0A1R3JID4_9ROSI|nr:sec-independent protein translocase protein TATC, chloroplastic-like protein [Corchorus olitorius]
MAPKEDSTCKNDREQLRGNQGGHRPPPGLGTTIKTRDPKAELLNKIAQGQDAQRIKWPSPRVGPPNKAHV